MGYTYQEARQAWRDLRFSIAYTSSDGDLARKLDKFFDIADQAGKYVGVEVVTTKLDGTKAPAFKYGEPSKRCTLLVENDEHVCHCGLRWDAKEERPPCPHGRSADDAA